MEHTHVWRKVLEALLSAFMGVLFSYWSNSADGGWMWFFLVAALAAWFSFFSDLRGIAEELDRRADLKRERRM